MPRKPASVTDTTLIAAARERGATITPTQLERWRHSGLLPRNQRRGAGQGRGSISVAPAEAIDLAVWLSIHARRGRRTSDLAFEASAANLAVPEKTVRAAWRSIVTGMNLGEEVSQTDGQDYSDWIAAVVEQHAARSSSTLVPRRIRAIDARVAAAGISWTAPELARYDRGPAEDTPFTSRDFRTLAASAALGGTSELNGVNMAAVTRAMLPAGAASPVASMLEYPDGTPEPADINDGMGLSLLPTGDIRVSLLQLIERTPLERLRAAWDAAADQYRWAHTLCDAAEAELDDLEARRDRDYPALREWFTTVPLGLGRMLLCMAIGDAKPTTARHASTALNLLFVGSTVSYQLRALLSDAQMGLLPLLLPPFLHELAGIPAPHEQPDPA